MATLLWTVLSISTALVSADIINFEFSAWAARGSDSDLMRFITRPDISPPKLAVTFHNRERAAPGYVFVAPYDCLECSHRATTSYVTQQIGPHIYTSEGELVWSGIDLFPDKKMFDFRPVIVNGEFHLAAITPQDAEWHPFPDGAAIIMDSSYQLVYNISSEDLGNRIDLHEFNVIDNGRTALLAVKEVSDPKSINGWSGKIMECYVLELDLPTNERRFEWRASDYVDPSESTNPPPKPGDQHKHWDWFHLNSIDKDMKGDYLLSARATNTIFLVSKEGPIIWRLGGVNSSFEQDFTFSRQHHARIRRQSRNGMVISFFDNAADDSGDYTPTAKESGLMIVGLDFTTMKASLFHRHPRPDGGLSEAKGNVEYLPNGGVLGGWGENAYMTEYSKPGGAMVWEAQFASRRFANYRSFKMDFVGRPSSPPDVKAFVSANSLGQLGTRIYVSWNGATEVARWRFYSHSSQDGVPQAMEIGNVPKKGFETMFLATGYHPIISAEAIDRDGQRLANSSLALVELPAGFHDPMNPMYSVQRANQSEVNEPFKNLVIFLLGMGFTILFMRLQLGRDAIRWRPRSVLAVRKHR